MLPGILNQLGAESLSNLKKLATNVTAGGIGKFQIFLLYLISVVFILCLMLKLYESTRIGQFPKVNLM